MKISLSEFPRASEPKRTAYRSTVLQLTPVLRVCVRGNVGISNVIEGDRNDIRPILDPTFSTRIVHVFDKESYSEAYQPCTIFRLLVYLVYPVRVPFPRSGKPLPLGTWCRESIEQRANGGL